MSEVMELVDPADVKALSTSLNYQAETLEGIFEKKRKQSVVNDLEEKLGTLLKNTADAEGLLTGYTPTEALSLVRDSFTGISESAGKVASGVDPMLTASTIQKLERLEKAAQHAEGKIAEIAEATEEEHDTKLRFAQDSLRLLFEETTTTLTSSQTQLAEAVKSRKDLALDEKEQSADYFMTGIATALFNDILPSEDPDHTAVASIRGRVNDLCGQIDEEVGADLNAILHDDNFKEMEANWTGMFDLLDSTDWSANVAVDMLDVTKDELGEDFRNNAVDLTTGEFFKKLYTTEYDQYGGFPYTSVIGLYEFENTPNDRQWLSVMGKVANASHAPFISSVGPAFFGCETMQELSEINHFDDYLAHPRFAKWQQFRDTDEAAYIGLTFPKYLLRAPYDTENNPAGLGMPFSEEIDNVDGHDDFLWANASFLFARNMLHSYATTGWAQHIRGPKAGGKIENLPRHVFQLNGETELKSPIELTIPDYRELSLSNAGFIPLVYRKNTADACFFSAQSIKKSRKFKDPRDSENSQLVTNLSYTFSIVRIAHYVKCMMRDNIGTTAGAAYIDSEISRWLNQYVTTVVNPDDLTLRHYPFKATQVMTEPREGMIGWYNCKIAILPHIQFEGMDAELRLDVRLGGEA
jgi:type VI secretion system protein ImpC